MGSATLYPSYENHPFYDNSIIMLPAQLKLQLHFFTIH